MKLEVNREWRESDLAKAVDKYFSGLGYNVKNEIKYCDVVAQKIVKSKPHIIVVETKLKFNLKLLYQAVSRLEVADEVYLCFLRPANMGRKSSWRDMKKLAKHMGLGVLLVSGDVNHALVQVALEAGGGRKKLINKKRKALENEFLGRQISGQVGGVSQEKILTAYRELAISLAAFLKSQGPSSTTYLRASGFSPKSSRVLLDNHYGWFNRLSRGVYDLNKESIETIAEDFPLCWQTYCQKWSLVNK